MKEQSKKGTPANPDSLAPNAEAVSEKLQDEQLTEVSGGTTTNSNDRLANLETRTIVQTDKGAEPGQPSGERPFNAG
ncbi:MAG: hypothetical protein AB8B99_15280 [Phormidesmis sp.]